MVASEYGNDVSEDPLGAIYAFVDELTALLRFLSLGLVSTLAEPGTDSDVFYRVCVKAMSNLASIRTLCVLGFDGNARIQLRLHYETMVLWARLRIDPPARKAFRAAVTPEGANAFWRAYIRGRKSEAALTRFCAADGGWLGADGPFAERVAALLGVSSHPSNVEMRFNAEDDWNGGRQDHLVVRGTSPSSHFTLGAALWATVLPFHIPPIGFQEIQPEPGWIPPEAVVLRSATWDAVYYERLQELVLAIFVVAETFLEALNGHDDKAQNC